MSKLDREKITTDAKSVQLELLFNTVSIKLHYASGYEAHVAYDTLQEILQRGETLNITMDVVKR